MYLAVALVHSTMVWCGVVWCVARLHHLMNAPACAQMRLAMYIAGLHSTARTEPSMRCSTTLLEEIVVYQSTADNAQA